MQNNGASVPDQALIATQSRRLGGSTEGFDPSRVRVTAADYNGSTWDGSPFSHVPKWLESALRLGAITIVADDRDYALWAVETPTGTKIAEPGDDIVCLDGHMDVQKDSWLVAASGTLPCENNEDCSRPKASGPTLEEGDAHD